MVGATTDTSLSTKILLVEDDRNFGDVLRSYLEMHGYDAVSYTHLERKIKTT